MKPLPRVSVIIAAYQAHRTIGGCLSALLGQSVCNFETIVVDSSRSDLTESLVRARFPRIRYVRSPERLLPDAARNRGAAIARGDILVFTDSDAYAAPDWLEQLLAAHDATGQAVAGAVACYGDRWLDLGVHLHKFDKWLPGGRAHRLDVGPTVNLLCPRGLFDRLGGFREDSMHGDAEFSWRLAEHGQAVLFAPAAIVRHHHLVTWPGFVRERYRRGKQFGRLRAARERWGPARLLLWIAISTAPLRLFKALWRGAGHARRAGRLADFGWALPVIASGDCAWLGGEAASYAEALVPRRASVSPTGQDR